MTGRGKAYEYESLEDFNNSSLVGGIAGVGARGADWEHRQNRSIPTSYSGSALNRLLTEDDDFLNRKYNRRFVSIVFIVLLV